jgi:hypothetical protein
MDTSREHQEGPAPGPRRLEQHDPDVQASTAAGAFDTTGSGVAPETRDYSAGGRARGERSGDGGRAVRRGGEEQGGPCAGCIAAVQYNQPCASAQGFA